MSTAPVLPRSTWEQMVDAWRELDVPEGWRAEIMEEQIVMTPPPGTAHNLIADLLNKALVRAIPDDWGLYQTLGVSVSLRNALFIPDFVVIPRELLSRGDDSMPIPAESALLVVEITFKGNADRDRKNKLWGYAHAEVPLYLLIDRFAEGGPSVELFSGPANGVYQESHRVPFGEKITLPAPFEMVLNTGEF